MTQPEFKNKRVLHNMFPEAVLADCLWSPQGVSSFVFPRAQRWSHHQAESKPPSCGCVLGLCPLLLSGPKT